MCYHKKNNNKQTGKPVAAISALHYRMFFFPFGNARKSLCNFSELLTTLGNGSRYVNCIH